MKKATTLLSFSIFLLFSNLVYAQSLPPGVPSGKLPDKSDCLKRVYLQLATGLSFEAVRNFAERYCPDLELKDTDVWMTSEQKSNKPVFYWVLGLGAKMIPIMGRSNKSRMHKIILRLDFNSSARLMNAIYVRYGKNFKKGDARVEERLVLVGADNFYRN